MRRLLAHENILFSTNLPQRLSANHVCPVCHAGFTRNLAGSGAEASGAGYRGNPERPDEVRRHHDVALNEVVY